ncbi:type II toxin-antitoxin system RelE/ParE family toxin [Paenibacillus sp. IB182496]|uniref:Type II toxin-antitoxin system RelE/ParE family toxin n=1 Tax=Paenibacillus sabuli TaxID=2772509 RepID=A0A927GSG2_9BACL|nr:type II toxin-antitoxin system RelE/ParE family toxin [Paenibacillus sabuli]MBD2846256.1 type II toxin-antitoxin system RelE/ParE family toxin [Paenibacillus sabuli]
MSSSYKIVLTKNAAKALGKLHPALKQKVAAILDLLSVDPYTVRHIKPLQGTESDYRIRIGSLRLIYRLDNGQLVITVLYIGSRGDAYK